MTLTPHRAALATSLLWLGFVAVTLTSFGMTSDSPSLFYAGDRHLFWLTHPTLKGALDFLGPDPTAFHTKFSRFPEHEDPQHYPVFPGFVGAIAAALTSHWLGPVDGHQLGLALLQAVSLYIFARLAISLFGLTAGFSGALFLAFFPCVVGHAVNNAKDLPSAIFYGSALLAGARGVLRRSPRDLLLCGVLTGVALSCKPNAVFALVTLLLWTPLVYVWRLRRDPPSVDAVGHLLLPALARPLLVVVAVGFGNLIGVAVAASLLLVEPLLTDVVSGKSKLSRAWLGAFAAIPLVAIAVFIAMWPWLWAGGGSSTFASRITDYFNWMVGFGSSGRAGFTAYPLRCLVFTTPPLLLALAVWGGVRGLRRGSDADPDRRLLVVLLFLWLGLPLLRMSVPHSMFYDQNRHFLEYVPALALLAGLGFAAALERVRALSGRLVRAAAVVGVWATAAAALAVPIAVTHPYETAYFNWFIGGLGGAQRSALLWVPGEDWRSPGTEGDYWHSSLRDFLHHLGSIVPPKALIGTCGTAYMQAAAEWNGDLRFATPDESGEYMYVGPRENFCGWARIRTLESQRPVLLRVMRDGGLIYEILGPKVAYPLPVISPPTRYDPLGELLASSFLEPSGTHGVDDSALENGKAIEFSDNAKATATVQVPKDARSIVVHARGDQCEGPPVASVAVDGVDQGFISVESSSWKDYWIVADTTAGQHTVEVAFTNDKWVPPGCDRNFYLGTLKFQ